jgi:DUF971 family protein
LFDSWLGAKFDHSTTGFLLTNGHANLPCLSCHINNNYNLTIAPTDCGNSGCHLTTWNQTNNPPHPKSGPAFAAANCVNCHTTVSWNTATFDHSTTGFLLTNGHANVPCASCHVNNNYTLTIAPTDCGNSGCHLTTWNQTNNPPHPKSGPTFAAPNCVNCHTTVSWNTATFDHSTTGFMLTQGHANVPCASCHVNNNYALTIAPNDCGNSGCHLTKWQQTTTPVHSTAGPSFAATNCANCHTPAGWDTAAFDHSSTGFALVGTHMSPTPTPCASCHINNNYSLSSADCMTCHTPDWNKTQTLGGAVPNHVSAGFPSTAAACSTCHTITTWADGKFDHSATGFLLTNGHANVQCASCHINGNYNLQIQPTDCGNAGCHLTTWQQTNNPVHSTAGAAFAAVNCAKCHTTQGWDAASFDHSATGFALIGTHKSPTPTPCLSCHVNNNYTLNSADCMSCHTPDWNKTQTLGGAVPNHVSAGFPSTAAACSTCHTITTWADGKFDHSTTGFLLTNGHANVQCAACHINGNYNLQIQPTDCGNAGCHLTTWQQTNNPVHSTSGAAFAAANCSKCHTTQGWDSASFDHSTTGFALVGTHMSPTPTPCASCHINNNFTLKSADCLSCHQPDWNKTQTLGGNVPNHVASNFPTTAAACWSCHTITTWADGKFDHSTTGFPLANSHQLAPAGKVTACTQCHIGGNYTLNIQPNDCGNSGCHLTTWQQTNNPTHPSAGAPFAAANCATCHNTITWTTATFDHSSTGWPLTGSHQLAPAGKVAACTDCHVNNNYTFTSANTDCLGCHQTAWQSTQTLGGNVPNHITANFPSAQCATCHNTVSWNPGKFDHSTTGFPLANSHQMAPAGKVTACTQCHIGGNYTLNIQPNDCGNSGCHLTTWQQTNNPTHPTAGAPFAAANCATCHNTITWTTATFDHSTTGFALTGTHTSPTPTPCVSCHVNNNYNLNTADCLSCHQPDWNKTQTLGGNVPNHVASNFPTTAAACSSCHTITTWADGKFDHSTTGWALVGSHQMAPAGKVTTCTQCHVGGNYALTSANTACIGCHQSDWNSTATLGGVVPNHITSGFSTAQCATCHDTVLWADGKFDHSTTGWALTGAHADPTKAPCTACHVNGNYTLTSANTACYGCHLAAWQSTQTLGGAVPNHVAAGFPTTCDTSGCHNTTSWLGATFNHTTFFPIPHHGSVCNDCHQVSTDFTSFTCINCHTQNEHTQTRTNNQHGGVNGYSYGPTICYNCHKNGGG